MALIIVPLMGITCNFAGLIKDRQLAQRCQVSRSPILYLMSAGVVNGIYYPFMFEVYGNRLSRCFKRIREWFVVDL